MAAKKKAQMSMDDRVVSNSEVLALLEEREDKRDALAAFRKADKDAKEAVKKLIADGEKPPFRIGPYLISQKEHEERHVEFEITGGTTIKIQNTEDTKG